MKQRMFIFIKFAILCALCFSGACTSGSPATPALEAAPTSNPPNTQHLPVTAPSSAAETVPPAAPANPEPLASSMPGGAVTQMPAPSEKKAPRPTKAPKDNRQPLSGAPASVPSFNPDFIASEILGRPTDTTITVNVVPAQAMEFYYEYGTSAGSFGAQTAAQSAAAAEAVETLLSGLQPDTRYYYRIRYRGGAGDFTAGQEHTFVTQRAPGSTFTFGIQGDSHPERVKKQFNAELYTRTLQSAAADQPDFYMTIGDDFSVEALKTVTPEAIRTIYLNQRQYLGLVGAPVFLVNGNHEQAALANLDGTPDNVAVWTQNTRNTYYPQPAPDSFYTGDAEPVAFIGLLRDYYAFTWGDALFVVIDPYWHSSQPVDNQYGADRNQGKKRDLWNITLGDAQYQWFKHTLETSSARYKFVFAHHVNGTGRGGIEVANTYEWGDATQLAAHRPGWDKTIHQLMVDNGVSIFFQGHDHLFAYQELDGVVYQTLPVPADPHYATDNANAYQSGKILPASGHVRVTVSPNGVTVDYIRSYLDRPDELAFSYTLP